MNSKSINVNQPVKRNRSGGGRPFHSRLESFVGFIRQQRQQRKTWQEIATLLRTEKGCAISFQGLHQFYRRYLKRQSRPHWENESAALAAQSPVATPNEKHERRKPVLAATPSAQPFRQPNSDNLQLNDPTKV
jgi:hypothetical protein